MAEATHHKHGFFQSISSVLPTHNPLHRHKHAENDLGYAGHGMNGLVGPLPAHLTEPPSGLTRKKGDLISAHDQLTLFRSLAGIDNPPGLHASTFYRGSRPASNIGIYARVVQKEAQSARSFKLFSAFISFCIGAQVLVAACLTALGAGNASHRAVTAFGAFNTVLAGFMAYFKGSGLPNRLKYYKNEWTKLREYIEQRERDFCREDHTLDLEAEVLTIERMYEEVKSDIESNTPDSFVSVRDISKRGLPLARPTGTIVDGVADKIEDRAGKSVADLKRNLSYQGSAFGDRIKSYGDEKIAGITNYGDEKLAGFNSEAIRYGDEKLARATSYGGEVVKPYQDRATELQRQADELQEQAREAHRQVAEQHEKISELGQKAYNVAGKVSSFFERPHTLGLTINTPESPQREEKKKGPDHMV